MAFKKPTKRFLIRSSVQRITAFVGALDYFGIDEHQCINHAMRQICIQGGIPRDTFSLEWDGTKIMNNAFFDEIENDEPFVAIQEPEKEDLKRFGIASTPARVALMLEVDEMIFGERPKYKPSSMSDNLQHIFNGVMFHTCKAAIQNVEQNLWRDTKGAVAILEKMFPKKITDTNNSVSVQIAA